MNRNILFHKKGFSLLEITVAVIILTIIASAVIPVMSRQYLEKAAQKTALDMSVIEDASRKYYVDNATWPSSLSVLQGSYLPASSAWSGINPFGASAATPADYQYSITPSGSLLVVSTLVPIDAQPIIQNLLPVTTVSGGMISSTISVPGSVPNPIPPGTIFAWPGQNIPTGYVLCDGSVYPDSTYPNLAAAYGSTYGGDGSTTFGVPDCRGRSIVGINPLTVNDGTPRIWSMDNYSNDLGQPASYTVNEMGGIFGEEKHRQTVVEMAPHSHGFVAYINGVKGFSGESTTAPRNSPDSGTTSSAGGNGDGTSLGAAANIVQPSIAFEYIIKT